MIHEPTELLKALARKHHQRRDWSELKSFGIFVIGFMAGFSAGLLAL